MESLEEETKYSLTRKASVPSVQLRGLQDSCYRVSLLISTLAAIHGLPSLAGSLRNHFPGRCLNMSEQAVSMVTSIP